jgi:hypothetical protein
MVEETAGEETLVEGGDPSRQVCTHAQVDQSTVDMEAIQVVLHPCSHRDLLITPHGKTAPTRLPRLSQAATARHEQVGESDGGQVRSS